MPAMRLRRVVFPEPEGPMRARNSPRGTSRERSWSGVMRFGPFLKDLERLRMVMNDIASLLSVIGYPLSVIGGKKGRGRVFLR